ncbi:photosystem II repair protein Psb32 [Almyronema epifaneia]|uniref:Photosystem II repair protein Psb32 n=1 Tax=Almyronema epifaneia S1 TaxID=2991925 RepID=A0ABW6IBB9_9CYAN
MRKLLTCLTAWKQWSLGLAIAVCALQLLALPAYATGVYQMPQLAPGQNTWVVDDANQISRLNEGKISDQLRQLAQSGTELRLVTIHRLDYGETPQSFADQLFAQWFPTPEAQANQALLVLDDVTNGAALKVGEAAAQRLTPDIAESVAQETIQVPLRQGNKYNQAFLAATDRLVAVLSGAADPGPPVDDESFELESTFASAEETEENRSNSTAIVVGFLIAATLIPMATYWFYQSMGG